MCAISNDDTLEEIIWITENEYVFSACGGVAELVNGLPDRYTEERRNMAINEQTLRRVVQGARNRR